MTDGDNVSLLAILGCLVIAPQPDWKPLFEESIKELKLLYRRGRFHESMYLVCCRTRQGLVATH